MSKASQTDNEFLCEFIQYYKLLPALWNIKCKDYRNPHIKKKSYLLLLKKYRERYPAASLDYMKKKLSNMRGSFRRIYKKKSPYDPILYWYNDMSFILGEEPVEYQIDVDASYTEMIEEEVDLEKTKTETTPASDIKCAPPLVVASKIDERTLKREGVCAASLPTTMGIVAGFLVQNTLKQLLGFGTVSHYLGYSALTDFFPMMSLKPNTQCDDNHCRTRQIEARARPQVEVAIEVTEDTAPVHADNEWGISLVDENCPEDEDTSNLQLVDGVQVAYSIPVDNSTPESSSGGAVAASELSLEELMQQMKSI